MKPIPKKLLMHSVILHKQIAEDTWGKETLDEGVKLSYVRLEPSGRIVRNKNGAEVQLAATLFYDCRNSRPSGIVFREDDIVIFNGQKHKVHTVEPLYDGRKLHHYEMGLIKHA